MSLTLYIPRVLVIDDDELFIRVLSELAREQNVPLTPCHSLDELRSLPFQGGFDVVILDYDLGKTDGLKLAKIIEELHGKIPIVLATHCQEIETGKWPATITRFVHKSVGPVGIIGATLEAYWKKNIEDTSVRAPS